MENNLRDKFYVCDKLFPSSWWSGVEQGPPDAIFGLVEAHKKDPRPNKVSVAIGAYRDGQGKPLVLPTVRKVSLTRSDIRCCLPP